MTNTKNTSVVNQKEKEPKTYSLTIKISAKTKRDLEICASKQSKTIKKFAKEALETGILDAKRVITENNTILYTQLHLFENE